MSQRLLMASPDSCNENGIMYMHPKADDIQSFYKCGMKVEYKVGREAEWVHGIIVVINSNQQPIDQFDFGWSRITVARVIDHTVELTRTR